MNYFTWTNAGQALWVKMGMDPKRLEVFCKMVNFKDQTVMEFSSPDFKTREEIAEKATDDAWEKNR